MKKTTQFMLMCTVVSAACLPNSASRTARAHEPSERHESFTADPTSDRDVRTAGLFGLPIPQQWSGQSRMTSARSSYRPNSQYSAYPSRTDCPGGNCGPVGSGRPAYTPMATGRPYDRGNPWQNSAYDRGQSSQPYGPVAPTTWQNTGYRPGDVHRNTTPQRYDSAFSDWQQRSEWDSRGVVGPARQNAGECVNGRCDVCDCPGGNCTCGNSGWNSTSSQYGPRTAPRPYHQMSAPDYRPGNSYRY